MANHLRRQIREAIGTAVTGLTTTSTRVYQSRVVPLQDTNLPALLIYTRAERSSPATVHGPRIVERTAEVEIVAVAKAFARKSKRRSPGRFRDWRRSRRTCGSSRPTST
jgi:hypothetical protein